MNKNEFITKYAEDHEISKAMAKDTVESVMNAIIKELSSGENFEYPGLGKLVIDERGTRTARNPQTGEEVMVPAKKVVKFKVAKPLKNAVANL